MTQALRLADSQIHIKDSLYFERRRDPRRRLSGSVSGVIREPSNEDGPARMIGLELIDLSDSGVGLAAQEPIPVGTRITIFFPPHGAEPGFDLAGHVVRCRSNADRHVIGVALSSADGKQAG